MKLDHVTILVSSLNKSLPYYAKLLSLLGFAKQRNHVWTDHDGFFFQFLEARAGTQPYERYGAGLNHLGFGASSTDHVDLIRNAMRDAGFDVPDIQNLDGAYALFMKDPDGLRFEITYYPPGVAVVD